MEATTMQNPWLKKQWRIITVDGRHHSSNPLPRFHYWELPVKYNIEIICWQAQRLKKTLHCHIRETILTWWSLLLLLEHITHRHRGWKHHQFTILEFFGSEVRCGSHWIKIKVMAGLHYSLEALGENLFHYSWNEMMAEFVSMRRSPLLAGCQLRAALSFSKPLSVPCTLLYLRTSNGFTESFSHHHLPDLLFRLSFPLSGFMSLHLVCPG